MAALDGGMGKMNKRIIILTLSFLMAVLFTSCSEERVSTAFEKLLDGAINVLEFLNSDDETEKNKC